MREFFQQKRATHRKIDNNGQKLLLPYGMPDIVQIGSRETFRKHGRLRCFVADVADIILYFMNEYITVI